MLCNDAFKKVGTCYTTTRSIPARASQREGSEMFREGNCNCWPAAVFFGPGLATTGMVFWNCLGPFLRSQHPLTYKNIENYFTSSYPHHDAYTFCYWQIFWHSIWHIFWHFIWHIWHIWHIFWHSIWRIFCHSTWHIFCYMFWHIFWHSIWHIFWHSIWQIF